MTNKAIVKFAWGGAPGFINVAPLGLARKSKLCPRWV